MTGLIYPGEDAGYWNDITPNLRDLILRWDIVQMCCPDHLVECMQTVVHG